MTDHKLLAEWFWTDRWMGSRGFLLPMEARGLYREMLTQAWRRGARLPNDPETIRRATGATLKEWERSWPKVAPFWRVDGESLINETQQEIYAETKAMAERLSARGRRASQSRRCLSPAQAPTQAQLEHNSSSAQAVPRPAQAPTQAQLEHNPPSPSPSTSSPPVLPSKTTPAPGPPHRARSVPRSFAPEARMILDALNAEAGRSYRPVPATLRLIEARLREGATVTECRAVITQQVTLWRGNAKMWPYLRPETLFNATKFAGYLGRFRGGPERDNGDLAV